MQNKFSEISATLSNAQLLFLQKKGHHRDCVARPFKMHYAQELPLEYPVEIIENNLNFIILYYKKCNVLTLTLVLTQSKYITYLYNCFW